jgi:hypothetical protein
MYQKNHYMWNDSGNRNSLQLTPHHINWWYELPRSQPSSFQKWEDTCLRFPTAGVQRSNANSQNTQQISIHIVTAKTRFWRRYGSRFAKSFYEWLQLIQCVINDQRTGNLASGKLIIISFYLPTEYPITKGLCVNVKQSVWQKYVRIYTATIQFIELLENVKAKTY